MFLLFSWLWCIRYSLLLNTYLKETVQLTFLTQVNLTLEFTRSAILLSGCIATAGYCYGQGVCGTILNSAVLVYGLVVLCQVMFMMREKVSDESRAFFNWRSLFPDSVQHLAMGFTVSGMCLHRIHHCLLLSSPRSVPIDDSGLRMRDLAVRLLWLDVPSGQYASFTF